MSTSGEPERTRGQKNQRGWRLERPPARGCGLAGREAGSVSLSALPAAGSSPAGAFRWENPSTGGRGSAGGAEGEEKPPAPPKQSPKGHPIHVGHARQRATPANLSVCAPGAGPDSHFRLHPQAACPPGNPAPHCLPKPSSEVGEQATCIQGSRLPFSVGRVGPRRAGAKPGRVNRKGGVS